MSTARTSPHALRATLANAGVLLALCAAAFALLPLHDDAWWNAAPRARQWWLAGAGVLAYAGFCGWIGWRTRPRATVFTPGDTTVPPVLVAHASQTGSAHDIAMRTCDMLRAAGVPHVMRALGELDAQALRDHPRALFVASTTGEGDPPDPALAFVAGAMAGTPDLTGVGYGVLALGDREYEHFCGFGHRLDQWLHRCGARPLFDLTDVDNGDPGALRHWQHNIALLSGATDAPDWSPPRYQAWTLAERRLLNPGSAGGAVFDIALHAPADAEADWQAGDLLEIGPCNAPAAVEALLAALGLPGDEEVSWQGMAVPLREALSRARLPAAGSAGAASPQTLVATLPPLPHREYSIASLPHEGQARLLVRRMLRDDGTPGIGSGWLCGHAAVGSAIAARLRRNPNFHAPDPAAPMILIGNGTGIAGLRAHLVAREAAGARRNWLVYGERNADRDDFFGHDIARWQREDLLQRVDRVFSRDGSERRYVQDALRAATEALREWIDAGAAVYVCGSLQGMAPAVDAVLREAVGNAIVDAMLASGRYRRDVY